MAKQKPDNTNLSIWISQKALADELNVSLARVGMWIKRGKIQWRHLPGSRIKLVNRNTITIKL